MSAFVRLSSKLPGDPEINGVDALADELIKDPRRIRYGVVWFDASRVVEETDSGDVVPTLRIRRIEPVTEETALADIAEIVAAAVRDRTGRTPIPFGIVEVGEDPEQLTIEEA